MEGWAPEFEIREAAVYCNYTPDGFRRLDWWERACCVAQYRLHQMVELHSSDAVNAAAEREMRKQRT